jgi:hypothetical protein
MGGKLTFWSIAALFASVAALALPGPAAGVQSLFFSLYVPCDDADGVTSYDILPITLPPGFFVATASGGCAFKSAGRETATQATPCEATIVGAIPCATVSVGNLPGQVCAVSAGNAGTEKCTNLGTAKCMHSVLVNEQCLYYNGGFITHYGGPARGRFVDTNYTDNTGGFTVTLTWTPR